MDNVPCYRGEAYGRLHTSPPPSPSSPRANQDRLEPFVAYYRLCSICSDEECTHPHRWFTRVGFINEMSKIMSDAEALQQANRVFSPYNERCQHCQAYGNGCYCSQPKKMWTREGMVRWWLKELGPGREIQAMARAEEEFGSPRVPGAEAEGDTGPGVRSGRWISSEREGSQRYRSPEGDRRRCGHHERSGRRDKSRTRESERQHERSYIGNRNRERERSRDKYYGRESSRQRHRSRDSSRRHRDRYADEDRYGGSSRRSEESRYASPADHYQNSRSSSRYRRAYEDSSRRYGSSGGDMADDMVSMLRDRHRRRVEDDEENGTSTSSYTLSEIDDFIDVFGGGRGRY